MAANAVASVNDEHSVVEHLQRAFGLCREIDVARRVEQRQRGAIAFDGGLLRVDCDATLLFECVKVEMRAAVVDAAELADRARAKQQRLDERRLPSVNVGEYAAD